MSQKELTRVEVMQQLKTKRLTQAEAAVQLQIGVRQVKRLWRVYKKLGRAGLISKQRGQPSNHRLPLDVRQQATNLIHQHYTDFGPTLAHEKLTEKHHMSLSVESVRRLMIDEDLWHPRRAKKAVVHQMRERRACLGELVQIDGSPFDWFEGRAPACTLLVLIDDATGRLMELHFTPQETMFSYCEAMRHYLQRHGKPQALYSDKHGVFRVNIPGAASGTGLTQFGRAMEELGIQIICANTPQAKGRVERANQTLQDRLVKELRLRNISGMDAGNQYLPEFMADFNARFGVAPRSTHNAHRPLLATELLDRIFTWQETRVVSKNLTVQYNKVVYQIQTPRSSYALRKAQVLIRETAQGEVTIEYQGRCLPFTLFEQQAKQSAIVPSKLVNDSLDSTTRRTPTKPAADHPWRTYKIRRTPSSPPGDISTLHE